MGEGGAGFHAIIDPLEPYRLDLTALALQRVKSNVVDVVANDGRYMRALTNGSRVEVVEVRQAENGVLQVHGSACDTGACLETLETMLGTRVDLHRFYRRAERFPWLTDLARKLRGLKPPRYPTLWEALCNGIIFQQLSIAAASTIMRRFVECFSTSFDHEGVCLYPFPTLEAVLHAQPQQFEGIGLSSRKAAYLKKAAAALHAGELSSALIASLPSDEAGRCLQELEGVGAWSAANVLLRGFGRLDVFPPGDSGALRSLVMVSGDPNARLDEILEELGDMRGMLYFHLLLGRYNLAMTHAQALARALNALTKEPQFSYTKARAAARQDANVDWPSTKARNSDFNPEVDGCESFVMRDGSLCEWVPGKFSYAAIMRCRRD